MDLLTAPHRPLTPKLIHDMISTTPPAVLRTTTILAIKLFLKKKVWGNITPQIFARLGHPNPDVRVTLKALIRNIFQQEDSIVSSGVEEIERAMNSLPRQLEDMQSLPLRQLPHCQNSNYLSSALFPALASLAQPPGTQKFQSLSNSIERQITPEHDPRRVELERLVASAGPLGVIGLSEQPAHIINTLTLWMCSRRGNTRQKFESYSSSRGRPLAVSYPAANC